MNIIKIKTRLESTGPLVATDIGHSDVCNTVVVADVSRVPVLVKK